MSAIIKGFVQIDDFVTNVKGQVYHIGELSDYGRTFSKEKSETSSSNYPGYTLIGLKTTNDIDAYVAPTPSLAEEIFGVVRTALAYTRSHVRPFSVDDFAQSISADFYERISGFSFGDFSDNSVVALPQWMSWVSLSQNNIKIKVWLSDSALRNQYDEYSIDVIPPLDVIDQLFLPYNQALTQVNTRNLTSIGPVIAEKRGDHRETSLCFDAFGFVNVLDNAQVNPVVWTSLVYGPAGDNIDARKDAVVKYITENTDVAISVWEQIFPELFQRTEFFIIPRWDKQAVPNRTQLAQLYSTYVDPTESLTWACSYLSDIDPVKVRARLTCMPYGYKELSLMVVGGSSNPGGVSRIESVYPDYLPLPNTSIDFDRMQTDTKTWVLFLESLLMDAEIATQYSSVSPDHRKVYRNGHLYVAATLGNINFLVAAREDYLSFVEAQNNG